MEPKTLFLFSIFLLFVSSSSEALKKKTYIIQLHPNSQTAKAFPSKFDWHLSFLQEAVLGVQEEEEEPSSRILYSYTSAIEGFSAQLTEPEAETLRNLPEVVAVRPDHVLQVQTTYSYKFLGLDSPGNSGTVWSKSRFGRGTIIGVLDTGVWPESPSFDDTGMPSAPSKWKGVCQEGESFTSSSCNRKLIGARFFIRGHRVANSPLDSPNMPREYISARDSTGHGTHTASTAGGSSVSMASVLGNGAGVARGMAPGAHVAVYKVCWFNGCYSSDILAAIDVAIQDRVDVLSLSLGGFPIPLYDDTIAIGTFRATEHGIAVVCAGGNSGPLASSVANTAPWVSTVGAGTLDRKFPGVVRLANGKLLYGESLYPGKKGETERELEVVYVTGGDKGSEFCLRGSLPKESIQGKMVICDRGVNGRSEKGQAVKEAGGVAMILANTEINQEEDSVDVHLLPATLIGYAESVVLKGYVNSTVRPKARIIFGGTVIGRSRAPEVAQFSARGPSLANPSILKPDLIAPGVNIIAAWPQNLGPTGLPYDSRRVNFTVMSGTSMSCPHVSGITALIRSTYPNWSPAAIRSAIMTTADVYDRRGKGIRDGNKPAGLFAVGAGHVNPVKAINPGMVYNIEPADYIAYLCTLGFTRSDVLAITHKNVSCGVILRRNPGFSLNYPSISVIFGRGKKAKEMITRRVTNVGRANSIYTVNVKAPVGIKVIVNPKRLVFSHVDQTLTYRVWFVLKNGNRGGEKVGGAFADGELTWVNSRDSMQRVRSPISVTLKNH